MTAKQYLVASATVFAAILLTAARLPVGSADWLSWLEPNWALAVVLYWALVTPGRLAILLAWLLGILVDVLNSELLGIHALSLAIAAYFAWRFQQMLAVFSTLQNALLAALMAFAVEAVVTLLRSQPTGIEPTLTLVLSPATTALAFAALRAWMPSRTRELV